MSQQANHIHAAPTGPTPSVRLDPGGGYLVALEGPKGAGKTTLCAEVTRRLEGTPHRVVVTKEPTASFNVQITESRLVGRELAAAIAADRAGHVRDLIMPALEEDKTVLCDRYILSSLVFQGADGVPAAEVWKMNDEFPLPDLIILLTASPEAIGERRGQRQTLTRLEAGRDPAGEEADYLRHAESMRQRGVELMILDNTRPEDLDKVVQVVMDILTKDGPAA